MRTVTTPWGPRTWDPTIRRVQCRGTRGRRCIVNVPADKEGGQCHSCVRIGPAPRVRQGRPRPTRVDDILGLMRYCNRCRDWWPADAEFWYEEPRRPGVFHCRAHRGAAEGMAYRIETRRRSRIHQAGVHHVK